MCDFNYKVCMMGDSGVGKTQILNRLTNNDFEYKRLSCLGKRFIPIDFGKETPWTDGHIVHFDMFDVSGNTDSLDTAYLRNCKHFVICYDVSNVDSYYNALGHWTKIVCENVENPKIVYVGNKGDQKIHKKIITPIDLVVSALENKNLTRIFQELIRD